jgi:hypothetical protein
LAGAAIVAAGTARGLGNVGLKTPATTRIRGNTVAHDRSISVDNAPANPIKVRAATHSPRYAARSADSHEAIR